MITCRRQSRKAYDIALCDADTAAWTGTDKSIVGNEGKKLELKFELCAAMFRHMGRTRFPEVNNVGCTQYLSTKLTTELNGRY